MGKTETKGEPKMDITEQGLQTVQSDNFVTEIQGYLTTHKKGMGTFSTFEWKEFLTLCTGLALAGEDYNTIMFAESIAPVHRKRLVTSIPGMEICVALNEYDKRKEFFRFVEFNLTEINGYVAEQQTLLAQLKVASKSGIVN